MRSPDLTYMAKIRAAVEQLEPNIREKIKTPGFTASQEFVDLAARAREMVRGDA